MFRQTRKTLKSDPIPKWYSRAREMWHSLNRISDAPGKAAFIAKDGVSICTRRAVDPSLLEQTRNHLPLFLSLSPFRVSSSFFPRVDFSSFPFCLCFSFFDNVLPSSSPRSTYFHISFSLFPPTFFCSSSS